MFNMNNDYESQNNGVQPNLGMNDIPQNIENKPVDNFAEIAQNPNYFREHAQVQTPVYNTVPTLGQQNVPMQEVPMSNPQMQNMMMQGTPIQNSQMYNVPMQGMAVGYNNPPVNQGKKNIYMIAGVCLSAIIIAIVAIYFVFFSNSPDSVVKKYTDAYRNFDGSLMVEVMHPKMLELVDGQIDFIKRFDDSEEAQSIETAEDYFDYAFNMVKDTGLTYKEITVSKEYKNVPLEEKVKFHGKDFDSADLLDTVEDWGLKRSDVKELRLYHIKVVSELKGEVETKEVIICVGKVVNKWYVLTDGI